MRSISSPLTPARSTAALTAVAPRSVADASANAPCIAPMGVRAIERMTVASEACVAMAYSRVVCCSAHKAAPAVVQTVRALLAAVPDRRQHMSERSLDFDLGEMADAIR